MKKSITIARRLSLALLGGGVAVYLAMSCSTEHDKPRDIRAHTRVIKGISHAEPGAKAERYCSYCHGTALQGGVHGEPSCYKCHGKNWKDDSFEAASPPLDHTVVNQQFHHLPGLFTPESSCVSCHGADLMGDVSSGATQPGCTLCHSKLWQERTPPPG